jgi:hypothetical protein
VKRKVTKVTTDAKGYDIEEEVEEEVEEDIPAEEEPVVTTKKKSTPEKKETEKAGAMKAQATPKAQANIMKFFGGGKK